MLRVETEAQILTAVSKDYEFDGKSGTSHRVRVLASGEIFDCKSSASQVKEMQEYVGKTGNAVLVLTSPKERIAVALESFEE